LLNGRTNFCEVILSGFLLRVYPFYLSSFYLAV
jgi:hypothetical protein